MVLPASPERSTPEGSALPEGWSTRVPGDGDIGALTALLTANRRSGASPVDVATLTALVVGPASWTRRQLVVLDPAGNLVGWVVVHDRASGRTEVTVLVTPDSPAQDAIAAGLFGWADRQAAEVASLRRAPHTAGSIVHGEWERPYSREHAVFPVPGVERAKYWPPVARIDQAYGDRNLVCACPPLEAFAE